MSSNQVPQGSTTNNEEDKFPVAAIICIAIGAYIVLIAIILLIRQILMKRGIWSDGCTVCGKEAQLGCCECCIGCGEACNCCANRSIESCLDSICPARRQLDCADIIMCKCCTDGTSDCCSSEEPLCDCPDFCVKEYSCKFCMCPEFTIDCVNRRRISCAGCACDCKPDCDCDAIDCCCFQISLKSGPPGGGMNQYPQYPQGDGMGMGGMGGPGYGMNPGYQFPNQQGMGGTMGSAGGTMGSARGNMGMTGPVPTSTWGSGAMGAPVPQSSRGPPPPVRPLPRTTQPSSGGAPY